MTSTEELQPLIIEPREDLAAEYKYWLNLKNEEDKAKLAKAAIALANHGGGYIVIGFKDKDQILESMPRPEEIPVITQDSVNGAVQRYAEPRFHCGVYNVPHPDTCVSHPVITVPGTLTVPVMSKKYREKVIASNRCYIRKSGPASEEPNKPEEWRTLLNRCVRANQDEMLESIRSILTGRVEMQDSIPNVLDELQDYCTKAHDRWQELLESEPDDSPARFPHGYYEMAFSLVGATPVNSCTEVQNRLRVAQQIDLSGWSPFLAMQDSGWTPYPHEDFVEAWLGQPDHLGRKFKDSYQCDFWRVSLNGKLYTIRGYLEDGGDNEPGRMIYATLPIRRIGEGLLFASRFAETFEEVKQIALHCRFTGLKDRCLALTPDQFPLDYPLVLREGVLSSSGYEITLTGQVTQQQIQDNLAEVLHTLLQQLYEQFNFFSLPFSLVAQELHQMRSHL